MSTALPWHGRTPFRALSRHNVRATNSHRTTAPSEVLLSYPLPLCHVVSNNLCTCNTEHGVSYRYLRNEFVESVDQIFADSAADHSRPAATRFVNLPVRCGDLAAERESTGVPPPIPIVLHSCARSPPMSLVLVRRMVVLLLLCCGVVLLHLVDAAFFNETGCQLLQWLALSSLFWCNLSEFSSKALLPLRSWYPFPLVEQDRVLL